MTSVSLELEHAAERAAWNSTASCVVIGDASGRLHFVTGEGTLIFSQPLAKPVASRARHAQLTSVHCAVHDVVAAVGMAVFASYVVVLVLACVATVMISLSIGVSCGRQEGVGSAVVARRTQSSIRTTAGAIQVLQP